MMAFFTASPNLPFTVALTVMFLIAMMEGVSTVIGMGISEMLESLLPEFDVDIDADLDADGADGASLPVLSQFLGWLQFGRVPALVLLIIFLTIFGLAGLICQQLAVTLFNSFLPLSVAVPAALILALPGVRCCGGIVAKIIPKDETSAVSSDTFIGRVATITLGTARRNHPAEGRLQDHYGQTHYLMIEPDNDADEFKQGDQILLLKKNGSHFLGILNTNSSLVD